MSEGGGRRGRRTLRPPLPMRSEEERERDPTYRPRGLAAAIIFDWALATLCGTLVLVAIVRTGATSRQTAATVFLLLVVGLPLLGLAEALRRGKRWSRGVQIAATGIVASINAAGLLRDLGQLVRGEWPRATNLPSLLAGIFIIWGLTRPQTIAWFAGTTSARARALHDGHWTRLALPTAVLFGISAALASVA